MEKLSVEYERTKDTLNYIYFFKEGDWYTAYELSTFLAEFYPLYHGTKLAPTRRLSKKDKSDVVKVGFKITSLDKFLPGAKPVETDRLECLIFTADLPSYEKKIDLENYNDVVTEWKNTLPIKEKGAKQEKRDTVHVTSAYSRPDSMMRIISEIMKYDTHGKDENNLRQFITELKNKCSSLIFG